jgi:hypothetical protein
MSTRLAAKKSAEGSDTEEESGLAEAVLNQEARLEGLRIAGEELEERLKRDLIASLKESEARQDVSATKLATQIAAANAEQEKRLLALITRATKEPGGALGGRAVAGAGASPAKPPRRPVVGGGLPGSGPAPEPSPEPSPEPAPGLSGAQDQVDDAAEALERAERALANLEGRVARKLSWGGGGGGGPADALGRGGAEGSGPIPYQLEPWNRDSRTYRAQLSGLTPKFVIPLRASITADEQIAHYGSLPSGAQDELDYIYTATARLDDILYDLQSGASGGPVLFDDRHELELVAVYEMLAERTDSILDRAQARGDPQFIRNEDESKRKFERKKKLRQPTLHRTSAQAREDEEFESKIDSAYIAARVKVEANARVALDKKLAGQASHPKGGGQRG